VKRGDIWIVSRLGQDRKVAVVGHDKLTETRGGVLVVPISDVLSPDIVSPVVSDADGTALGVALIPRIGEVSKTSLSSPAGALAPESVEVVDVALRAALDL